MSVDQKSDLPEELRQLESEFLHMKMDSSEFFSGLSDKAFNTHPSGGGWSIGECIDHLIVTGFDYCDKYEEALAKAREKNLTLSGKLKRSWFANKFINNVEPPVKLKLKAPKKWRPDSKINKTKAVKAYLQLQDRWMDLIQRSAGWDIGRIKLSSPATNLIKFSGFETLCVNSAHQRRHFLQAKKVWEEIKN